MPRSPYSARDGPLESDQQSQQGETPVTGGLHPIGFNLISFVLFNRCGFRPERMFEAQTWAPVHENENGLETKIKTSENGYP